MSVSLFHIEHYGSLLFLSLPWLFINAHESDGRCALASHLCEWKGRKFPEQSNTIKYNV